MLKQKAVSATLWSAADIVLRQGLQLVVSITLARLLTPNEFGTIALLYLFTGVANVFVDSGLGAALIQRRDITHTDESTVFWFNISVAVLAAAALWTAAPLIADFYSKPILVPLTRALAINVFVNALGAIHGSLLSKRLDFRTLMKVGVCASVVSGLVAVALAWQGLGVWSLAVQTLTATLTTTVLLWSFNRWRPALVFSIASARRLFGFGGSLLASSLIDMIYTRGYTVIIGKFYGVSALGFYDRAESTKQLPVGIMVGVMARVAFPIFSEAAHDPELLRRGVQLAVRSMMFINAPMMLGMAAVAEPLVLTLFGEQWLPIAPVMRVLCLAGLLWPLHVINLNALMAQGHSHLFLRLEVIKKIVGVPLLVGGSFFGVMGIAWSQVIFGSFAFVLNAKYTGKYLEYGAARQLKDVAVIVAIAAIVFVCVSYAADIVRMSPPVLELTALVVFGAALFIAMSWGMRLAALQDILDMRHYLKK
jgi:teichuronic acid exporter